MATLSVDAARKVCEIGLTVIPVFALAVLVSERDKLQVPLGEPPPADESPEESSRRGRGGTYRYQNSSLVGFVPAPDPSDAVQLATGLPHGWPRPAPWA